MAEWHLITGEYPPQRGGVSDYTHGVAGGLAEAGERVHVWCPPAEGSAPESAGVAVHRELGRFTPSDLARVGRMLDRLPGPRRLLVQWVPHSYGYRSVNVPLCLWLWKRARVSGDELEVMVHEPYLPFRGWAWKHNAAALAHRLMAAILLQAARRVWVSAPLWAERWRPYALLRGVPFAWLPVGSTVPVEGDAEEAAAVRARYAPRDGWLLGHFGTYGRPVAELLLPLLSPLLGGDGGRALLLLGRGGPSFREEALRLLPELEGRVHATGGLSAESLSAHLRACDVMVQPYPEGVNSRRTTVLAALEHGVPVVTSSGGLTEPVWSEREAVASAPAGDVPALLARVDELLADPARRERVSAAARALYRERFELGRTIAALRGAE